MASPYILEAQELGRRIPHGEQWLLDRVSLAVRPGDRISCRGPSGSGKSLMLRALSLLDPLDHGAVLWRGASVPAERVPEFRSRVIYLHQRPALLPGTVEENLRCPFTLEINKDRHFDRARITNWLHLLGRSADMLNLSPDNLSGGEAQLVVLLRTLQLDPDVLLVDEPTAALDSDSSKVVESLIDHWWSEAPDKRALIWVSHDFDQARRVATRIVSMNQGQLQEEK